ncbi:MAG: NAD(P)-dependent glycerol-3-phosphate dehydrogenase [Coriobacteriaceae bacterium]|jgi:glycerol-3-phosphate dehydrogenase (NAD(P)+)|nr:NAD(P)-dependent glycerol-3-phosphate dehydrogenase [Coriobacteriaceae bacterium]
MKIGVIGAGSWGTALAQLLAKNDNDVALWARKESVIASINAEHVNPRYLSEVRLSDRIVATSSHADALAGAQACAIVTPSHLLREVSCALAPLVADDLPLVVCSKGIEEGSGKLAIEVAASEMGNAGRLAVLSGPNHAEEVIKHIPSGTVIASSSRATAEFFQELFASDTFRTYISDDVSGVEICAAFKNVIAIAVGLSYGLGLGDNTAAMLMTRGLAEMGRLVEAAGGRAITCLGLAGTGDLIATCMSQHSRNRRFGQMLAAGRSLDDFSAETHMVAEGALACKTLRTLGQRHQVELPITEVVRAVVWEGLDASEAARVLAGRPLTAEFWGMGS